MSDSNVLSERASVPAPSERQVPAGAEGRGVLIRDMNSLARFAKMVYDSGLAPKSLANVQSVALAVELGLELGLTPMMALQNIAVINGRPGIFGDAAKALVESSGLLAEYEDHPGRWCDACEREGNSGNKCPKCGIDLLADQHHGYIVSSLRRGRSTPVVSGFNIRQAKRAGLWNKQGPWTQYPNRMLMFRARGFNLRDNFPDVLKGVKTIEELRDYPINMSSTVLENDSPRIVPEDAPSTDASDAGRFVTAAKATELQELMYRKGFSWAAREKSDKGDCICKHFRLPVTMMIEDLTALQYAEIKNALLVEKDYIRS